jgi:STIP1 family protein 1
MQQKVRYINDILQALLTARKKKWDGEEVKRLEREWELLRYVKGLVETERTKQLDEIVDKDDTEKVEEINYNSVNQKTSPSLYNLSLSEWNHWIHRMNDWRPFKKSSSNHKLTLDRHYLKHTLILSASMSSTIPALPLVTSRTPLYSVLLSYLILSLSLSFACLDGITYERHSLLDHFSKNGHFDPITRSPCTEKDLIPNLSLRESIEDFLKDNGWAAGRLHESTSVYYSELIHLTPL